MRRFGSAVAAAVRSRSLIWWAALGVALCGVVATAHGLYEVVLACGVLAGIAALYVPLTDGLALVAYAATSRLQGRSRAYAWVVVVLGAGLSGVSQAVNLGGLGEPPTWLRYGVGAWPALAVAIVAHLLWLVSRPVADPVAAQVSTPATASAPVTTPNAEPVALHRPHAVAAAEPRRPQVSAAAGRKVRPSKVHRPCVPGCDRHDGTVSYDTRKRCAERLGLTATA